MQKLIELYHWCVATGEKLTEPFFCLKLPCCWAMFYLDYSLPLERRSSLRIIWNVLISSCSSNFFVCIHICSCMFWLTALNTVPMADKWGPWLHVCSSAILCTLLGLRAQSNKYGGSGLSHLLFLHLLLNRHFFLHHIRDGSFLAVWSAYKAHLARVVKKCLLQYWHNCEQNYWLTCAVCQMQNCAPPEIWRGTCGFM